MPNSTFNFFTFISVVLIFSACALKTEFAVLPNQEMPPSPVSNSQGTDSGMIKLHASLTDPKLVLHQPIFVQLTVTNEFAQSISLDLGQNYKERFVLTVKYPDGSTNVFRQGTKNGTALIGDVSIETKKTYVQTLAINDWFTPHLAGTYTLEGKLTCPGTLGNGNKIKINSDFKVEFTVDPEDRVLLESACETLLSRIVGSHAVRERADAARTLSMINSPVATPYIKKALSSNLWVESKIIKGLTDRGGEEAVKILIDVTKSSYSDPDVVPLARSALMSIDFYSSDPRLKQLIQKSLKQ